MKRPTSVMVFAILNIVFGALGFCGVFGNASMLVAEDDGSNPVIGIMRDSPLYQGFIVVGIPLGLIVSAVLVVGGIGMLKDKVWGRTISIAYAWYAIVATLIGIAINLVVLMPPAMDAMSDDMSPEEIGLVAGAFGGSCGAAIGLAYPIILLFFMYRASVKAWFDPHRPAPGSPAEPDPFGPPLEPWDR